MFILHHLLNSVIQTSRYQIQFLLLKYNQNYKQNKKKNLTLAAPKL